MSKYIKKPKPKEYDNLLLSFSYAYFQTTKRFNFDGIKALKYIKNLKKKLKDYSKKSYIEMFTKCAGKDAYRFHLIKWEDVSENKFGIPDEIQLVDQPYQLGLGNDFGRIHGFFIQNTFHIVWFDPHHKLYPRDKKTKKNNRAQKKHF